MNRRTLKTIVNVISMLSIMLFAAGFAFAQDYSYSQNANGGYQGRVVRLSLVEGDVSIQHGPNERWLDALINVPLMNGDRLWVGAQGRAEIEFDDGSYVRLASNSVLEIQQLDNDTNGRTTQLFLSQGLGYFNIRGYGNDVFRVTTPSLAADTYGTSRFRLEVNDRNDLIVFGGEVQVNSYAGNVAVHSRELFSLTANNTSYYLGSAPSFDSWDRWNFDRDSFLTRATATNYVPASVGYGTYDLDRYGRWAYQGGYGWVWSPYSVSADWVPYSYGRWVFYPTIGYTWVSYEPWGWLPYHYGGWSWIPGFGWGWAPGVSFSYWSPARVFFFNYGGYHGWCPWSPFDTFYGGGSFINVNFYRPRNFRDERIVIVNNNTFINNVVSPATIVRNREVLNQVTTSRSLEFAAQPRVEKTAFSEVIRPASAFNNSGLRVASDTKGWGREDGIRGTGARPPESLRMVQPFASAGSVGINSREATGGNAGATMNNRNAQSGRGEVLRSQGPTGNGRNESGYQSQPYSAGRSAGSGPTRYEGGSRETVQPPANRTPYSGVNDGSKGRVEGQTPNTYNPPAYGGSRAEAPGTSPSVQSPRNEQYRAPAPQSRPNYTPPPINRNERPQSQEKPKTAPQDRNAYQPAQNSYRESYPARQSYEPARTYTPPPVQSYNSRSSYSEPRSSPPAYSAPAQRYEAPRSYSAPAARYEAPQYQAPRYEAPRASSPAYSAPAQRYDAPRSYSAPSMPRQNYSQPSGPAPSYHSAPAPRGESRPSGNANKEGRRG